MFKAISVGEYLIDFVSTTVDVPLGDCPGFHRSPGGAPANVAVGVAKLGARAGFIGKVGDDPFGHMLKRTLEENGVETRGLVFDDYARTTLAFIANRSDGKKDIVFYRNPGADIRLTPDEIDPDYVATADILHFGSVSLSHSPSREATLKAVRIAKERGSLISYDPNFRPLAWDDLDEARFWTWNPMELADIAKVADEEWEFITGTPDLDEGCRRILDSGVKLVIVTRGENGCYLNNGNAEVVVDGFHVNSVDATGAGDGFVAAVLCSIMGDGRSADLDRLDSAELKEIALFANAAGAITTTRYGVIPALPSKREIDEFLAANR